jgi:hypothetical protein
MRTAVFIFAVAALGALGCSRPDAPSPAATGPGAAGGSHNVVQAYSMFGPATVKTMGALCAGRVTLAQGRAEVKGDCFSGDGNIVICTDATAPNPVMCAPRKGLLSVAGTAGDTISYARVQ